ncbi:hypothetical protein ACTUSN_14080 [Pantoea ananatis]|uniref:hypothetical protein n=1 Tax=Pantoea ananas TaxID=553 RepID=UPI003FA42431
MTELDYDREVYNRNFLNCSQRQGIVALESLGFNVAGLFYNAQISTDLIREQIFLKQVPRYDFIYDGLRAMDYSLIGVKYSEEEYSSFEGAIPRLVNAIQRDSFVLVSCDVFLVPHRPEFYYKKHINHFITLLSYDEENNEWQAIDDLSSGHLAKFTFTTKYLSEICNASELKVFRTFEKTTTNNVDLHESSTEKSFENSRVNRIDHFTFLSDILTMGTDKTTVEKMANVFAVIMGSRVCFAKYLQQHSGFTEAEKLSLLIATEAKSLRNLLSIYAATGGFRREEVLSKAENIARMERSLSELLE